eukprot:9504180-Pyramimonas_sp.AAC.4
MPERDTAPAACTAHWDGFWEQRPCPRHPGDCPQTVVPPKGGPRLPGQHALIGECWTRAQRCKGPIEARQNPRGPRCEGLLVVSEECRAQGKAPILPQEDLPSGWVELGSAEGLRGKQRVRIQVRRRVRQAGSQRRCVREPGGDAEGARSTVHDCARMVGREHGEPSPSHERTLDEPGAHSHAPAALRDHHDVLDGRPAVASQQSAAPPHLKLVETSLGARDSCKERTRKKNSCLNSRRHLRGRHRHRKTSALRREKQLLETGVADSTELNTEEVFLRYDWATWSAWDRGTKQGQNACLVTLIREQGLHAERIATTCRGALIGDHCPHGALRRARRGDIVDKLNRRQMERPCSLGKRHSVRLHREALEDATEPLFSRRRKGGRLL